MLKSLSFSGAMARARRSAISTWSTAVRRSTPGAAATPIVSCRLLPKSERKVLRGTWTERSWFCPRIFPFRASTPMTRKGRLPIRMLCPSGFEVGNRPSATSAPRTVTELELSFSGPLRKRPEVTSQPATAGKSAVVPWTWTLASERLANFTSSVLKVIGATAETSGRSRSCSASGGVSSRRLRYLKKSPRMIQGNLVTYIEFAPMLASCRAKDELSPWMMPTMASRVQTPMPIPMVVRSVRRRLARSARTAIFPPSTTSMRIPMPVDAPLAPSMTPVGRADCTPGPRWPPPPGRSLQPVWALGRPLHPAAGGGAGFLQLLQAPRPVLLEEPRERAIGQEPSAGLAGGTVVRLVVGVDDALDRRAAVRTRLPVATVDGHPLPEGGHLLRKSGAGLLAKPVGPGPENGAGRLVESPDLVLLQPLRQRHRGQAGGVEDLVRIRVADAAEEPRVGERPLQGVVLATKRGGELLGSGLHRVDASAVQGAHLVLAAEQPQLRSLLGAGLGEDERAGGEIERREADPSRHRRAAGSPVEPAGDHEVEDEEQPVLEHEDQPLALTPERGHPLAGSGPQRWIGGANQRRPTHADSLQRLAQHARGQRLQVDGE